MIALTQYAEPPMKSPIEAHYSRVPLLIERVGVCARDAGRKERR
jgi:hypothetical protein